MKGKFLLINISILSALVLAILGFEYKARLDTTAEVENYLNSQVSLRDSLIKKSLENIRSQIQFLYSTPPVQGIVRASENNGVDPFDGTPLPLWKSRLETIFKAYIENSQNIFQIRYIGVNNDGQELIRVDKKGSTVTITPPQNLQHKSGRDYFIETAKLAPGEIYISDINLNREHGKVEFPYVPTIRAAMPVHDDNGAIFGIIIINVNAGEILTPMQQNLKEQAEYFLLDAKGNFIFSPYDNLNFSSDLETSQTWSKYIQHPNNDPLPQEMITAESKLANQKIYYVYRDIPLSGYDEGREIRLILAMNETGVQAILSDRRTFALGVITFAGGLLIVLMLIHQRMISKNLDLKESQSKTEAIINGSYDAIIGMDRQGVVTSWNLAASKIFKFPERAAMGKSIFELFLDEDSSDITPLTICDVFDGIVLDPIDVKARDRDGKSIFVSVNLSPIRAEGKRVTGVAAIVRDITRQKYTELQLSTLNESLEVQVQERTKQLEEARNRALEASEAKSSFVANMSHEIRTPMNAILGLVYLLQKQNLPPSTIDMVNKIENAGRSLLGIINDILDFSKIEANRLDIENIPFQLSSILDNIANIMASSVGEKPVEVVVAPAPKGADFLEGDPVRLTQILINLVGNAIKFTEQGEVVVNIKLLNLDEQNNTCKIRFSVKDTGTGIPAEKQKQIFDAFSQADSSITRTVGGTGLGLTISRHLVELMGGELCLNSQLGKGSEFFFELTFNLSQQTTSTLPNMLHQHILIVDDHDVVRSLLVDTANSLGWSPVAVDSGDKAVQVSNKNAPDEKPYDIFLIDWQMPGMDGLATAKAIKEQYDKTKPPPIFIMVTAYDRDALKESNDIEIIDDILTKPVTSSCLYNAVLAAKNKRGEIAPLPPRTKDSHQRLTDIAILVVDDSEINREVAKAILMGEGATVELAEDGAVALSKVSADRYDIVLMDVQMPVMDGYAACRQIKSNPELRALPVVALTAGAFKTQQEAAMDSGMDAFVSKPFNVDELVETVLKLVNPTSRQTLTKNDSEHAEEKTSDSKEQSTANQEIDNTPLIDFDLGLKNWGNASTSAFHKMFRFFLQDHENDGTAVLACIEAGDDKKARAILHKLHGASGSLALSRLMHFVAAFESQLIENQGDKLKSAQDLCRLMTITNQAIEAYLNNNAPDEKETPKATPTDSDIGEICQKVLDILNTDDPVEIEQISDMVTGQLPEQLVTELQTCIDSFDFRTAEMLIHSFIGGLKKQHGDTSHSLHR